MILPDLNLLLYAYNPHAPQHELAREWWESVLNSDELIGMPLEVSLGFVRIATHPRLGPARIGLDAARSVVETWTSVPQFRDLLPGVSHFQLTMDLMQEAQASGSLVSDARLAAYAIEARATLCSNDSDFARFPRLKWRNPLI